MNDSLIDLVYLIGLFPFKDTIYTNILYNSVQIISDYCRIYNFISSGMRELYKLTPWIKKWSSVANKFWNVSSVGALSNGCKYFNLRSWYKGHRNNKCSSSSSSSKQRESKGNENQINKSSHLSCEGYPSIHNRGHTLNHVGLTLIHRLRRWTNVKPTFIQLLVSAGTLDTWSGCDKILKPWIVSDRTFGPHLNNKCRTKTASEVSCSAAAWKRARRRWTETRKSVSTIWEIYNVKTQHCPHTETPIKR